jgi:deoxycitidine kinase/deoxyguanosine kinase
MFSTPTKIKRISSSDFPSSSSPASVCCLSEDVDDKGSSRLFSAEVIAKLRELYFACEEVVAKLPQEEHKPILISIEGNIGAGKSTLLQALRETHPEWTFIDEPVDFWTHLKNDKDESLFELYYHNQERWAYTFQNCAVLSRYQSIEKTIEEKKSQKSSPGRHIYITERCLETDYHVFAKKLHADGKLDQLEYALYESWLDQLKLTSTPLSGVILIDTPANVCYERIKGRNREGEESIPMEYLDELHRYQSRWVESIDLPCAKITSIKDVETFIKTLLL